jgi:hypothetical protein
MTQPKASPETMARLCEAIDREVQAGRFASPALETPLARYRAETTPPLRSRAEVAGQTLEALQRYLRVSETSHDCSGTMGALWTHLEELGAEPTAPEPAPSAEQPPRDELLRRLARIAEISKAAYGVSAQQELLNIFALAFEVRETELEPNPLTNHDQDTREERPCGCEQAEALKDQLVECKRLLAFAHERAREIVQALGGVVP